MLHAEVTNIQIGHLTIEGLLFDDGSFGVAVPQIAQKFLPVDSRNQASQTLKRLLGKDFKTHKIKFFNCQTVFNRAKTLAVSLSDFEVLVTKLDRKGNIPAQEFRDSLVGLSLHQLFCDSFGLKFEAEDRQQWLRERQIHRESFHPYLTKWLKADAGGNSELVNWGKEVNDFKRACQLPLTPIESWDTGLMSQLNRAEASYDSLRRAGIVHEKAVNVLSERS